MNYSTHLGRGARCLSFFQRKPARRALDKTPALLQSGDRKYDVIIGGSPGTMAESMVVSWPR
jgi:hypothetical protein